MSKSPKFFDIKGKVKKKRYLYNSNEFNKYTTIFAVLAVGLIITISFNVIRTGQKVVDTATEIKESTKVGIANLVEKDIGSSLQILDSLADEPIFLLAPDESIYNYFSEPGELTAAKSILSSTDDISAAANNLQVFFNTTQDINLYVFDRDNAPYYSLTEELNNSYEKNFIPAYLEIQDLVNDLSQIKTNKIPEKWKGSFEHAQLLSAALIESLDQMQSDMPSILKILGHEEPMKYLVLLENNNEIRPGGGFIGSFLLVNVDDGFVENYTFHDVYTWDDSYGGYIEPPLPELKVLSKNWRLRDSNYSPDIKISAEKAMWFLEKEGGPTVDGVIVLDLTFAINMLEALGDIELEDGMEINSSNMTNVLTHLIETQEEGEDKIDLEKTIDATIEKLSQINDENQRALMDAFLESAIEKHIFLYFQDPELQEISANFGLDGSLMSRGDNSDYFSWIGTNIGGNKVEPYISRRVKHNTAIDSDGELMNEVTFKMHHGFGSDEEREVRQGLRNLGLDPVPGFVIDILGAGRYKVGHRIYVPRDSELIEVQGLDKESVEKFYDQELDLDYFYFVTRQQRSSILEFTITYTSGNYANIIEAKDGTKYIEYELFIDKQPGGKNYPIEKTTSFPENIILIESNFGEQSELDLKNLLILRGLGSEI